MGPTRKEGHAESPQLLERLPELWGLLLRAESEATSMDFALL